MDKKFALQIYCVAIFVRDTLGFFGATGAIISIIFAVAALPGNYSFQIPLWVFLTILFSAVTLMYVSLIVEEFIKEHRERLRSAGWLEEVETLHS